MASEYMRKLFALLYLFCCASLQAQDTTIQWQSIFGDPSGSCRLKSTVATNDSGYIISGYGISTGSPFGTHGGYDILVQKYDKYGNATWKTISYGGHKDDTIGSIIATPDNGAILVGSTLSANNGKNDYDVSFNHGGYDVWVVKLDNSGSIIWEKSYGSSKDDYGASICSTFDGGYVIVGYSNGNDSNLTKNNGSFDFWVFKIDSLGKLLWQKSYGGSKYDIAKSVVQAPDSGFVICGFSESNDGDATKNNGGSDFWILKLDSSGNLVWQKSYGGSKDESANSIINAKKGYLVAGYTASNDSDVSKNHGSCDFWILEIDYAGKIVWERTYGGDNHDICNSIISAKDSGYILAGETSSKNGDVKFNHGVVYTGFGDAWILKISENDSLEWEKTYGGSLGDYASTITCLKNNSYVFAGLSFSSDGDLSSFGTWGTKAGGWIVKLSSHWNPVVINNSPCASKSIMLATIPSISSDNDSVSIYWDFGDGRGYSIGADTANTPIFTKAGNYIIKLRVTNNRNGYVGTILSEDSITITINGKTISTPTVNLKGKDTLVSSYIGDSCQWYLDSVLVTSGKCEYIATKSGKYQVMVYGSGCPSPISAAYNFIFVGVGEVVTESGFSLYPNPVNSMIHFEQHPSNPIKIGSSPARIIITDISGKVLFTQQINSSESIKDVSALPSGIYLFHYQDADRVWNGKFVKE